MTSWAKIASAGTPNDRNETRTKPIITAPVLQMVDSKKLENSGSMVSMLSKPVAVPNAAVRQREAASGSLDASSPTTDAVNPSVHQSSKSKSSSSDLNPLKIVEEPSVEASKSTTPHSAQELWEYDVYAAPFVPSELRSISREVPIRTIPTKSCRQVNYAKYTSTFSGSDFLPAQSTSTAQRHTEDTRPTNLTATTYQAYFAALLRLECAAKELENDGLALYKVQLHRVHVPYEDPVWALTIPGLREDSPFLEMGDILQLRRLRLDAGGGILKMPMLAEESQFEPSGAVYYVGWTGVQYDACVSSVNRAREIVYLKTKALAPLYMGYGHVPEFVNATLPLKHVKLHLQEKALHYAASELMKVISSNEYSGTAKDSEDGHDDFNVTDAMRDASNTSSKREEPTSHNDWLRRMLFPMEEDGSIQTRLRGMPHRELFDHAIPMNFEQAHAVNSVCTRDYGTLPYLISGPPGTGKTKTIVETAMQLFHSCQARHILICAPSEAASDTLALRLKQYLNDDQLFRLIRPGRADNEVPSELTPHCCMKDNMFALPPFKTLMAYNIVVTSCQDAGILFEARLTNGDLWHIERNTFSAFHPEDDLPNPTLHWGALLIDEAAQATEIDLLPAISVVCPPSGYSKNLTQPLCVLAGDENQLGPKTASRDPLFSTSLFARLADRSLYKRHPLSRSSIKPSATRPILKKSMLPIIYPPFTNLIRNYRSHPAILSVPSSLFYNDTLIPEAPTPSTALQHSSLWRSKKWPVLFIPNSAPDEIERDGGGWYNTSEALTACSIAQTLIYESEVKQKDICIMSPFAAQVRHLRSFIRSPRYGGGNGLWDVNIGPLEAFQGLEKRVVIICTTRTRQRFLKDDEKRGLGIVNQKRKMNVALTRAKEALFVIGNPAILMRDEHWRQWLAFCARNDLVGNGGEGRDAGKADFGTEKIGVLERALIAKEDHRNGKTKVLGGGDQTLDVSGDYEVWMESLWEAMDEESDEEEDGEEDGSEDIDYGVA